MEPKKHHIQKYIESIHPFDLKEKSDKDHLLALIVEAEQPVEKNHPRLSMHLAGSALIIDSKAEKVLLFDHKTAGLQLPLRSSCENGVSPLSGLQELLKEELGADFDVMSMEHSPVDYPFFITIKNVLGESQSYLDVSLRYLFETDSTHPVGGLIDDQLDEDCYLWHSYEHILQMKGDQTEPSVLRCLQKFIQYKNQKKSKISGVENIAKLDAIFGALDDDTDDGSGDLSTDDLNWLKDIFTDPSS